MDLEQKAIARLQYIADVSEQYYQKPVILTYSGGKDSDVCLYLAERAGIKYEVQHSLTTADAPQTIRHVKKKLYEQQLNGVKADIIYPEYKGKRTSMWRLIPQRRIPPTRIARYCCEILKETAGKNRAIITGVRHAESNKRNRRGELEGITAKAKNRITLMPEPEYEQLVLSDQFIVNNDNDMRRRWTEHCKMQGKITCNPIIEWTDHDVWDYIKTEHIETNPLYACGFERVGCIGCPMAENGRYDQFRLFPAYENMYRGAFDRMLETHREKGYIDTWKTADEVFDWWMEDKNLDQQLNIDDV